MPTFGDANVERIKYDPLYKIKVKVMTKYVIYIGKLTTSSIHPDLLLVNGIRLDKDVELTGAQGRKLMENSPQVQVLYPTNSFVELLNLSTT